MFPSHDHEEIDIDISDEEDDKFIDIRTDKERAAEEGANADEFFGDGRTESIRSVLGLEQLEEMSGAGAVAGYAAPLGMKRRKNKKTKHPPYNELYLYKEVLKLLMKEGVIK